MPLYFASAKSALTTLAFLATIVSNVVYVAQISPVRTNESKTQTVSPLRTAESLIEVIVSSNQEPKVANEEVHFQIDENEKPITEHIANYSFDFLLFNIRQTRVLHRTPDQEEPQNSIFAFHHQVHNIKKRFSVYRVDPNENKKKIPLFVQILFVLLFLFTLAITCIVFIQ